MEVSAAPRARHHAHAFALWACVIAIAAFAASATSLGNGFAYDDVPIVEKNPAVSALRSPAAYFQESYWGPSRGYDSLYRPLTILGFSVQWAVGGGSPFPFHVVNVALMVLVAVLAFAFLWSLLPPLAAAVGGLVFAVHPVHVEAVANVVGQAELWVAAAILGCLLLYARARVRGALGVGTGAVIAGCYFVALFMKEHGIVLPALIIALELVGRATTFTRQDDDWARARLLALVLVLLASIFLTIRVAVLGNVTGDLPFWGLRGLSLPERATVMLALVPEFLRLFVWPARLYADYAPQQVPVLPQLGAAHVPGAVIVLGMLGLFGAAVARARAPLVAFAVAWCVITLSPVSNLLFPTGVLLAERTLFLPTFAVALLSAVVVDRWAMTPGVRRTAILAVLGSLVVLATVHSAQRQLAWKDSVTVFANLIVQSPTNFRGHVVLGELQLAAGDTARADSSFVRARSRYPENMTLRLIYAQHLQADRRCPEALPLFESALDVDPLWEVALIGASICLLETQRPEEARLRALFGITAGLPSPILRDLRQYAESLLVATDSVDARNRWWRAGRPFDRTGRQFHVLVRRRGSVGGFEGTFTLQDPTPSATVERP